MLPERIVECVPNFSEGRRPEVVEKIVAAIASTPSVKVLDESKDLGHNRSVVTLVGESEGAPHPGRRPSPPRHPRKSG